MARIERDCGAFPGIPPGLWAGLVGVCAAVAVVALSLEYSPLSLVLLALGALGLALLLVLRPCWGLMLWGALLGVQISAAPLPIERFALADLVLAPVALGIVVSRFFRREVPLRMRTSMNRWLIALALVFAMGNLVGYFHLGGLSRYVILNKDVGLGVLFLSYFAVVLLLDSPQRLTFFLRALVIPASVGNVIALAAAAAYLVGGVANPLIAAGSMRLVGFMVNPTSYGGFLSVLVLLQAGLLLRNSRMLGLPRWWLWGNHILLMMGITLTNSRSTWVALLVGLGVLLAMHIRQRSCWIAVSSALLVLLLPMLLPATTSDIPMLLPATTRDSLVEFQQMATDPRGFWDRILINWVALELFTESWTTMVFGIGLGTFLQVSMPLTPYKVPLIIHNSYVWLLVEMGIIGFFVLSGFLWKVVRNLAHAVLYQREQHALLSGVAAALVCLLVWMLANEGLYQRHLWVLFGLVEVLAYPCWIRGEAPRQMAIHRPWTLLFKAFAELRGTR